MFEKKYKIIFVRKEYQTLNVVAIVQTNNIDSTFRYNGKTYQITIDVPTYSHKLQKVYIIDIDSGNRMKFEEMKAILNPNELDLIISTNVVKDLTIGALDNKEKLIMAGVGFLLGILSGIMGMMFYMQSKLDEIYESLPIFGTGLI